MDTENELIEDACMESKLSDTMAMSRAEVDFATAKGTAGWLSVLKGLPLREHPIDMDNTNTSITINTFCMATSLNDE